MLKKSNIRLKVLCKLVLSTVSQLNIKPSYKCANDPIKMQND